MNRFLAFIISIVITIAAFSQQRPTSSEEKESKALAEMFLINHGQEADRISLELDLYSDRLLFFDDQMNNLFILMARNEYADLLGNQVLALSIGVPHSRVRDCSTFMNLFNYYDKLILDIKEGRRPKENTPSVEPLQVMPMLKTIRWRQFRLNNVYENQTSPVSYGCGPVAVGQLMKYYQWPDTVRGSFCYRDANMNLLAANMEGQAIDWGGMKNFLLNNQDKDSVSLEPLMKNIGIALKVEYGEKDTRTLMRYIKRAMTDNFHYSPSMYMIESSQTDEQNIINLIRGELKAGRPSILCGGDHIFVCDGVTEDFLHLNMGWGGSYDGWYRFPNVNTKKGEKPFIESAIINITPLKDEGQKKSVNVTKPGTMSSLISKDELVNVSSLKVSGKINGADIRLLRRMSGATEPKYYGQWSGRLTSLDLSNATIIKDTAIMCTFDISKTSVISEKNSKRYDFTNMSDALWKEFCALGENNTEIRSIVKKDSTFIASYKTINYAVGQGMFKDCENLEKLILPKNTRYIWPLALCGCRRIKEITIPSAVLSVGSNAFFDCSSLEEIRVCSDSPILKRKNGLFDNLKNEATFVKMKLNPNLKIKIDKSLITFEKASPTLVRAAKPSNVKNSQTKKHIK